MTSTYPQILGTLVHRVVENKKEVARIERLYVELRSVFDRDIDKLSHKDLARMSEAIPELERYLKVSAQLRDDETTLNNDHSIADMRIRT